MGGGSAGLLILRLDDPGDNWICERSCLFWPGKLPNMKKHILFFFLLLLIFPYTYAQTVSDKNTLSLSIGPSFPVGHFSSTDPSDKLSGYAKAGEAIDIAFAHEVHNGFGLTAMLFGQRNGLNTNALARQLAETGIVFGFNGASPNHYPNWTIDKASWYTASLLAGITEQLPLKKNSKFSFTARALIGAAHVQSPKLNGSSKTDTSYAVISQNNASAIAFSYIAGIGLKYQCGKRIYLFLNADYFGTAPVSFKNITESIAATNGGLTVPGVYSLSNSRQPVWVASFTSNVKQPIGAINGKLGVALSL